MPVESAQHLFQPSAMTVAPDGPGVLVLFSGRQTIIIDWTDIDVRARLREHHAGKHGTCTQISTHFRCEGHDDPEAYCQTLLDAYKDEHGNLPRCNK